MKQITKFKRLISGVLSMVMAVSAVPIVSAHAEESTEPYPYTLFAASNDEGAITVNAANFCVNGNVATNGTIVSSGNMNINGTRTEHANESMLYVLKKLNYSYFSGENVMTYTEDYIYEDLNININNPIDVDGAIELTGNINLNSGIKALDDVTINGVVKNSNNAVICSETGDINIETSNVSFNGLIYAPYGNIVIDSDNLNLNNVVIIGQTITIDCPNVNANYNSDMANLIGNESDIDVELYAMGNYNADVNSIDIEWFTNHLNSNYEVFCSDDNESYSSIAVVSDATTYQYLITEDFERRYFKVSLITNYGEVIESVPFVATKTEDGYEVDFLDSDEDGLPDIFEFMIGTDVNIPDTDGDTLTDYEEVYVTGTDPTVFDSVVAGVSDADADSDGDGLTNLEEIALGTNPQKDDSDDDGLTDNEELKYNTDPINPDTDNDTLPDGDEPHIGLDPTNPETFGIPDAKHKVEQTIPANSETFSAINTDGNPYKLSVEITAAGYAPNALKAKISSYSNSLSGNTAIVGNIASLDYDYDEIENLKLKFEVDTDYLNSMGNSTVAGLELEGINRLHAFYYDKINNILYPVETEIVDNYIVVNNSELGDYCLIDLNTWLEMMDIDFSEPEEIEESEPYSINKCTSDIDIKNKFEDVFSDEIVTLDDSIPYNYDEIIKEEINDAINNIKVEGDITEESEEISNFSTYANTFEKKPKRNTIDLVYIIDTSGSMSNAIYTAKSSMCNLVNNLYNAGIDTNVAVVSYSDYGCDGDNGARVYSVKGSNWATNSEEASTLINQVFLYGCGHETPIDGLEMAHRELEFHEYATKFMVLITDEPYEYPNNRYGIGNMTQLANSLKSDCIYTSVVCYNRDASGYLPLYNITNGIQIDLGYNWPASIESYIKQYIKELKTYTVVIPNSLEKISLKEVPQYGEQVNSDEDELWDYEEIDWRYIRTTENEIVLPTLSKYYTTRYGINALQTLPLAKSNIHKINSIIILPIKSNPEKADSDGDGINDDTDTAPFVKGLIGGIVGELSIVSCNDQLGHSYLAYKSYVNDVIDLSGFFSGFNKNNEEIIPNDNYSVRPNEYITFGSFGKFPGDTLEEGLYFNREIYNYETLYKTKNKDHYTYQPNSYITRKIREDQLISMIDQITVKSSDYNLAMYNCVNIALMGWFASLQPGVSPSEWYTLVENLDEDDFERVAWQKSFSNLILKPASLKKWIEIDSRHSHNFSLEGLNNDL